MTNMVAIENPEQHACKFSHLY